MVLAHFSGEMRRHNLWLWAGMVGGLVLTMVAILRPDRVSTVSDSLASSGPIVARVNGRTIMGSELERVLATLREKDPNIELSAGRRKEILEQMIHEELLVQRAVEMGMSYKDPVARRLLLQSIVESIGGGEAEQEPTEADLKAYFKKRRALFAREGRVRLEHVFIRAEAGNESAARERALSAANGLRAGVEWNEVKQTWGNDPIVSLPPGLLTPEKVREYLGPTAARAAVEVPLGEVVDPIRALGGYHVLRIMERERPSVPPFEEVREAVTRAYREEQKARRVEAYVEDLRSRAEIDIAPEAR